MKKILFLCVISFCSLGQAFAKTQTIDCTEDSSSPLNRSAQLVIGNTTSNAGEAKLAVQGDQGEIIGKSAVLDAEGQLTNVERSIEYTVKTSTSLAQTISLTIPLEILDKSTEENRDMFKAQLKIRSTPAGMYDGDANMTCTSQAL
ncbi:MAG: hypothetical protein ACXVB9_18700 [Bdellovibrionota bacterium]